MRRQALYRFALVVLAVLLGVTTRRSDRGLAHVPRTGGVLVVCNHISLADPPVLVNALRRTGRLPRVLAAAHLFVVPGLGWALRTMATLRCYAAPTEPWTRWRRRSLPWAARSSSCSTPEGGISDGDQWPRPPKTGAALGRPAGPAAADQEGASSVSVL